MSRNDDKKIFAFDIDGTILSSKGELINNIAPFIIQMKRAYPEAKFAFVTSGTASTAKYAAKKIGEAWAARTQYSVDRASPPLRIDIGALGGSYVFSGTWDDASNSMLFHKAQVDIPLDIEDIAKISEILKDKKFGNTNILYYQKERMVHTKFLSQGSLYRPLTSTQKEISKIKLGKQRVVTSALKLMQSMKAGVLPNPSKKEFYDIKGISTSQLKQDIERGRVYTLGLVNLNKEHNKVIVTELTKRFARTGLNITAGTLLEVSRSNKWQTLKQLYGEDAENVIYFGDGKNDRECLKKCKTSFALGKKLDVLKSGTYSIENFIDAIDICLSGEETSELTQKSKALIYAAEEKAEKKANNIRSKVKSALKSNKEMGM